MKPLLALAAAVLLGTLAWGSAQGERMTPVLTREGDVFKLDGVPISPFGLRAANALQDDAIAQRFVDAMDDMLEHGIQSFALTLQGGRHTEGGNSAFNAFAPDGSLKPAFAERLARVLDAAAEKGMVPVVTLFYRGRDQELQDETAVRRAVTETMTFLTSWRHAWIHMINEPYHPGFRHEILTTPAGHVELYDLAKAVDPERIIYVTHESGANDGFLSDSWNRVPGLAPPANGDVVVEYTRYDRFDRPGIYTAEDRERTLADARASLAAQGYWFFHAAWHQKADEEGWPRFDKGGLGTPDDPGVAFAWDWMKSQAWRSSAAP
jgi:hypothetical protein